MSLDRSRRTWLGVCAAAALGAAIGARPASAQPIENQAFSAQLRGGNTIDVYVSNPGSRGGSCSIRFEFWVAFKNPGSGPAGEDRSRRLTCQVPAGVEDYKACAITESDAADIAFPPNVLTVETCTWTRETGPGPTEPAPQPSSRPVPLPEKTPVVPQPGPSDKGPSATPRRPGPVPWCPPYHDEDMYLISPRRTPNGKQGTPNGCGPENGVCVNAVLGTLPVNEAFRRACNNHDTCWGTYSEHLGHKAECDESFRAEMLETCNRRLPDLSDAMRAVCSGYAELYHAGVSLGGHSAYRAAQEQLSNFDWTPSRGCEPSRPAAGGSGAFGLESKGNTCDEMARALRDRR